ncbi:LPS export ABC transporter protein LptC [bacterium A37T11]|nr:LPS export ABC transporter protein LptC [bacterium A37T11]
MKTTPYICVFYALIACFALNACENNLKDVERLASIKAEEPVDISYGVTVIYSDSAKVKAKMVTPEMRDYNQGKAEEYYELPKGVLIIFYDEKHLESQRVTADYAINRPKQKITDLKHHVVVTRIDGTVFKSEELTWNEKTGRFYNSVPFTITKKNGDLTSGLSIDTDQDFTDIHIEQQTGHAEVSDEPGVPFK